MMDWIERLNRSVTGRVALPDGSTGAVEVLYWAHDAALVDNVPHRHTFFEVCLVGGYGAGIFRAREREYVLGPGDLFIARPGVLHQIRNTHPARLMELTWVSFAAEPHGEASALHRFADADVVVVPEETHRLSTVWNSALRAVASGESPAATVDALAAALLVGIVQAGGGTGTTPDTGPATSNHAERLVRLAVRYIHDNLNRPIAVGEVAAQVHLSPRHLTRLLETFTGVAPAAYIERARIDRAATLLTRTDDPIKRIAEVVGYADVHHFTRAFARVQGMPPGAYRKAGEGPIRRHAATEPEGALV